MNELERLREKIVRILAEEDNSMLITPYETIATAIIALPEIGVKADKQPKCEDVTSFYNDIPTYQTTETLSKAGWVKLVDKELL